MSRDKERVGVREFGTVLRDHRGDLFDFVRHRVGGNSTLAEDITQDCLVRVWETRQSNPPPVTALRTYLQTTARNLLRDRFRRRQQEMVALAVEPWDDATPETAYLIQEMSERLSAEVARMPFLLKETLRLRVGEDLDYGRIAAQMQCPVGTVKSRLNAARERLRLVLEDTGDGPDTRMASIEQGFVLERRTPTEHIVTSQSIRRNRMATNTEMSALREELQTIQQRLSALEGTRPTPNPKEDYLNKFNTDIRQKRKEKASIFGLGIVHIVVQSVDSGTSGTASATHSYTSADEFPDDRQLSERFERMRLLTSDPILPKIFRHFYMMRFAGREMNTTAQELAETIHASEERVKELLEPLVAGRILRLVRLGTGADRYEWDGNDPAITALLFTTPGK